MTSTPQSDAERLREALRGQIGEALIMNGPVEEWPQPALDNTTEAILAAHQRIYDDWLRAALSAPPLKGQEVSAVKSLEWRVVSYDPSWFYADGAGLRYSTFRHRSERWKLLAQGYGDGGNSLGYFASSYEAKAAAQADYEQRIRACLSRAPVSAEDMAVPEGGVVDLKPLDLSNCLKHAFEAGKRGQEWVDYDPDNSAYARVASALLVVVSGEAE